jgi:hypothetical protein
MLMKYASLIIDGLALLAVYLWVPALAGRMARYGSWNAVIILAAYLAMCAGLFLARRLEMNPENAGPAAPGAGEERREDGAAPAGHDAPSRRKTRLAVNPLAAWACWPFSLFVPVMMAMAGGFFERGAAPIPAAAGVPVFILTMLLFPLLLYVPARPRVAYGGGAHRLLRSLSVLGVDAMMIVTAAFWEWQLKDAEPLSVAFAGKVLIFLVVYAVFLMFYAAPRLALLSLEDSRWSMASYLVVLAVMVWRML